LFIFGSCSSPTGGSDDPPDPLVAAKAELQAAITAAEAGHATFDSPFITAVAWAEGTKTTGTFIVGSGATNTLPVGLYYIDADPVSAVSAYAVAIDDAKDALADADATVASITAAKDALATATEAFNTGLPVITNGTKGLAARIAAETGTTIYLYGDESVAGVETSNIISKDITLEGVGRERTITLTSNGNMFDLGASGKLTLDDKVTLKGKSGNNHALVVTRADNAVFTMKDGSKITGGNRRGVYIDSGTFTMDGGEISGNSTSGSGGGVDVATAGIFAKRGGTISGNTAATAGPEAYTTYGTKARTTPAGPTVRLYVNASTYTDPEGTVDTTANWQ
jgi:hypothetical protein